MDATAADVTTITLTLTDSRNRLLKRWSLADFSQLDDWTWALEKSYRVSGKEPWTLTLTVTDSAGQSVIQSITITK